MPAPQATAAVLSVPPSTVVSCNTSVSASGGASIAVSGGGGLNEDEKVNDLSTRQLHKYVKIKFC